ncbi:MAG: hypothetical protein U0K27_08120 [Segatella copri]|nr:hypothetical protein [Segatella copri]
MNKNLNVLDLMQVKGGKRSESESITCIFTAAVKCESEAVSKQEPNRHAVNIQHAYLY